MLLGLFLTWVTDGFPRYISMDPDQNIAYISDIGATSIQPLFIAGSVVTTVFLDLAFAADRYLRHRGVLAHNTSAFEKVLSVLAIASAIGGTVGLICLSIFDTFRHETLHDRFLAVFIIGYVLAAIFLCWEFQRLGRKYRQHRFLRVSFWIKLTFILVEIALAVVFGVCTTRGYKNVGAIVEWVIAVVFTFWVLSFLIDLLPIVRGDAGRTEKSAGLEMGNGGMRVEEGFTANGSGYGAANGYGESYTRDGRPLNPAGNF